MYNFGIHYVSQYIVAPNACDCSTTQGVVFLWIRCVWNTRVCNPSNLSTGYTHHVVRVLNRFV